MPVLLTHRLHELARLDASGFPVVSRFIQDPLLLEPFGGVAASLRFPI